MSQSELFAEEVPVKGSVWRGSAEALTTTEAISPCSSFESATNSTPNTSCGKTSPASCQQKTTPSAVFSQGLLAQMPHSFQAEGSDGQTRVWLLDPKDAQYGAFSTLSISEWPKDAAACSLSAILVSNAPPRYYLSKQACQGILRRAAKRGKKLPGRLAAALEAVAGQATQSE